MLRLRSVSIEPPRLVKPVFVRSSVQTVQTRETVRETVERFVRAGVALQAWRGSDLPYDDGAQGADRSLDQMDVIDESRKLSGRMRKRAAEAKDAAAAATRAAEAAQAAEQSEAAPGGKGAATAAPGAAGA